MRGLNPREQANLEQDLRQILGFTVLGGVRWQNVVIAQVRSKEWSSTQMPPSGEERGGSSSPVELAERVEDRRVAQQAAKDAQVLPVLVEALDQELVIAGIDLKPSRELATVAANLARVVARYIRPETLLPTDAPQCLSCARPGKVRGVQYNGWKGVEVYAKAKKHNLCKFCYDHASADAKERGRKGLGQLPPVDIIDTLHMEGPRKAGLAMARQAQRRGAA